MRVTRKSMSPMSAIKLGTYIKCCELAATPTKKRGLPRDNFKLIDDNGLDWKNILENYSYDFDWDDFNKNNWELLEERCERNGEKFNGDEYERFRVAQLLEEIFINHEKAVDNFENLIKRILDDDDVPLGKQVSDQIVKLIDDEEKKRAFNGAYEKIKTDKIPEIIQKNNFWDFQSLQKLVNRCMKVDLNFKKLALIGAVSAALIGLSYTTWKNISS